MQSPAEAYDAGYDANIKGKGEDANPYPVGTSDHEQWGEGWEDAEVEGDDEDDDDFLTDDDDDEDEDDFLSEDDDDYIPFEDD